MIAQVLAAAVGTVAFALLFGVPRKYYFYCGLVGGVGWLIYVLLTRRLSATETEAIFFATLGVILLCRVFAVREECPVTVFLIAGIFPLVPRDPYLLDGLLRRDRSAGAGPAERVRRFEGRAGHRIGHRGDF